MTVNKIHDGVSIHEYHRDVGTGISAIDTAAFAWLRSVHPGRPWLLAPETTYRTDSPVNVRGIQGQQLIGHNSRSSVIQPTYTNGPAVLVGDSPRSSIIGFRIDYGAIPADPAATAILVGGRLSQSRIEDVYCFRVAKGIDLEPGAFFFQNTIERLRVTHWSDMALDLSTGGSGPSGTGNAWHNIYLNNALGGGPPQTSLPCRGFMHYQTSDEQTFNQLNLEYATCSDRPVLFQQCGGIAIQGFHVEGLVWPDNRAIISSFSDLTSIDIAGAVFDYNRPASPANTQSLFNVAAGTRLNVRSIMVRNNGGPASLYAVRWGDSTAAAAAPDDARCWIENLSDDTGDIIAPTPPGTSQVPDSVFRRWRDEWFTIDEPGIGPHRITVVGGALTATPV